jgi:8-oxo-dGTP pyrophosphatase MutT (NUDIX family)
MSKEQNAFNKAGIMIHGKSGPDSTGPRSLLVPYNEGRFSIHGEYYVLPKGTIDPGEKVYEAAIRETREETGIDVEKLLGKENVERLVKGEPVTNVQSPGYEGVRILRADPVPYSHEYLSRASVPNYLAMFSIEVEGIDKLAEHANIKNKEGLQTRVLLKDSMDRPKFPDFIRWMQNGEIPATGREPATPLFDKAWFGQLVKDYAPDGNISTRENWQSFCKDVPGAEYKKLRAGFHTIKSHLKQHGWLGDDTSLLKFDEKDCPLFYYTEGARVMKVEEFLSKTFKNISDNPDFACAFGGQCDAVMHMLPRNRILHSQFAAVGPFVQVGDFRDALNDAVTRNGGKPLTWGAPPKGASKESPTTQIKVGEDVVQSLESYRARMIKQHDAVRTG